MALKAGRDGISEVGAGLDYDKTSGRLSLKGESDLKLDNLKDVSISEPLAGDVLVYNGEEWENVAPDSDPTDNSGNLVTSGGVYDALDDIWKAAGVLGAKNRFKITKSSISLNNVEATINQDTGIVTLNTSAPASANTEIKLNDSFDLPNGRYIFSIENISDTDNVHVSIDKLNNGAYVSVLVDINKAPDYREFTVDHSGYTSLRVKVWVKSGAELTDYVIKTMIRLVSDTDSTYQPYALTNSELTKKTNTIEDIVTLKTLPNNADLNDYTNEYSYIGDGVNNTFSNCPVSGVSFRLEVLPFNASASRCGQILIANKTEPEMYIRTNYGGTWQSWYKFTGTIVS